MGIESQGSCLCPQELCDVLQKIVQVLTIIWMRSYKMIIDTRMAQVRTERTNKMKVWISNVRIRGPSNCKTRKAINTAATTKSKCLRFKEWSSWLDSYRGPNVFRNSSNNSNSWQGVRQLTDTVQRLLTRRRNRRWVSELVLPPSSRRQPYNPATTSQQHGNET